MTRGKLVVWGYLGAYPFGGMTWQVLHYLAGLRCLGFDVWYVEDTDASVRDPATLWESDDYKPNLAYLDARMQSIGLGDRWIFRPPGIHDRCFGATDVRGLVRLYREADAVINLCGSHELRACHDDIRCLVYLETDPVAKQIAIANGDAATITELGRYDLFFTYGENLGSEDCPIPLQVFDWHATRPPVIVPWWLSGNRLPDTAAFSTVTSWTHGWNDVEWEGEKWAWSKSHEFRKIRTLPEKTDVPLELAVSGIDESEANEFRNSGWRIRPASEVADPDSYRNFICNSLGEFTVAKEQVVRSRSGWFSDRSVCYLAAGRPVITPNTGFDNFLPCGVGLLPFASEVEAVEALKVVVNDYHRHCAASEMIARDYFDADAVLRRMMATIGLI